MSVTRDEAQMITTLAIAARPHRAPTWDPPGVMAQLGKVAGLDLAEVAIAALRLARDPYAKTPADIGNTTAECWREQLKPQKWTPDVLEPQERCKTCGKARPDCELIESKTRERDPDAAHDFEPGVHTPRDVDLAGVITELRGHVHPTKGATEPTPHAPNPKVAAARELLHTPHPETAPSGADGSEEVA